MNQLTVGSVFLLAVAHLASGSLFRPFGPFGQQALPGYGGAPTGFPARPPVSQLPFFPPLFPASPYVPTFPASPYVPSVPGSPFVPAALPAFPPALGRALPAAAPAGVPAVPPTVPAAATGSLRSVASASDVLSRLGVADLPEDLQQRVQDLQATSETGFDACEELLQVPGGYWQYKRCNAFQLRNVLTAAKALEQEATARAAEAAAAAATAASVVAATEQVAPVA